MRRAAFVLAIGLPLALLPPLSAMSDAVAEPSNLAVAAQRAHSARTIGQGPPASPRASRPQGVPADPAAQARYDYMLHCSGCHAADGVPSPLGRIPALKDRIGHFMALPEGRAFLVQVPGVNNTGLDDAAIARVMNWVVTNFAGASLAAAFVPYTGPEVAQFRARRPVDVPTYRKDLARRLAQSGHPIDY